MINRPEILLALALLISGCASYGVVQNAQRSEPTPAKVYSLHAWTEGSGGWGSSKRSDDTVLMLAFSGGGTRAAAFSYGVLKALRDERVSIDGETRRLVDEVDSISSVSGGSFTSAYYGLYGEKMFTDFEGAFLKRDVEGALIGEFYNPFRWFETAGRTEWAVEYYQEHVFRDATFADMIQPGGPIIVINATDLGSGARFSFVQEYFDLLCSDLSSFPIARAVAASSAAPVIFSPIVVRNYADCPLDFKPEDWLRANKERAKGNAQLALVVGDLETYFDKDRRKYAHLVDGGITDNLGLRAMFEIVEVAGGARNFMKKLRRQAPRRVIMIVVDASTHPESEIDASNRQPSLTETVRAITDIQLHRYSAATIELTKSSLSRWSKEMSTPQKHVDSYFIHLTFRDIKNAARRQFIDQVPTSFRLTDEQVDGLIEIAGELLRQNPEFRRLLSDLREISSENGRSQ